MAENALRKNLVSESADLAEHDITLVEHNFATLMGFSDALAERFYQRLFAEYPETTTLFKSVTIEGQHKKLLASMVMLIKHLRDSAIIEDYLQGLGVRHQQYGVEASHYEMFIENWLSVISEFSEQEWNKPLQQAWRNILEYVAELMQTPFTQVTDPEAVNKTNQNSTAECALTSLAVAQTATPMVMMDLNLVVRYLNAAAESLLNKHQASLEHFFPNISFDSITGASLQHFAEKIPFPIDWFSNFEQLPRSIDLHYADLDLRVTTSVLYKNDEPEGFLLECYPQTAAVSQHPEDPKTSSTTGVSTIHSNLLTSLEKVLNEVQTQNGHLTGMLQEIDDAVFETSLLALNCTVEAAKLGDEARQLRDFSMEIRVLNQQLSQLLQPLKVQSGLQQQQLTKSIELARQLEMELTQNLLVKESQNRHSIEQISHQLSQQTQALTHLIHAISSKAGP